MTRTIEIPDDTTCVRCNEPATTVRRGVLYCGLNCAGHSDARTVAGELFRLVDGAQGGSPRALGTLDELQTILRSLLPILPDSSCPKCWAHMHGGVPMPTSQTPGEQCGMCGFKRPVDR